MKRTIGKIIVGGGLVLALAACGANTQTGSTAGNAAPANTAPTAAANTAPANNNSSTNNPPATGNGAPNTMPGANGQRRMPGLLGTVTAVNGSTLTVQDQRQQSTTTVDLTSSTQIFKQATVDLTKVTVGEQVSAVGSLDGGVFTATQIRIGTAGGAGMMGGFGKNGGGPGGANGQGQPGGNASGGAPQAPNGNAQQGGAPQAPNGTAQAGRGRGNRVFGTVDQVSGDTITVKAMDGTTTQVKLASNGQITEQVTGAATDITANERVAVMGQQNGTTITASQVEILPAMTQQ